MANRKEITIQPDLSQEDLLTQMTMLKLWLHDEELHPRILSINTLLTAIELYLSDLPILAQLTDELTVIGEIGGKLVRIPINLLSTPVETFGNLRFNGVVVLFAGGNVNFTQRSFGTLRFNGAAVLFSGANVNFTNRSFGTLRFNGASVLFAGGHVNF